MSEFDDREFSPTERAELRRILNERRAIGALYRIVLIIAGAVTGILGFLHLLKSYLSGGIK